MIGREFIKLQYIVSILLFSLSVCAQADSNKTHLITHNRVWIDATPEAIWPFILDTRQWKQEATQFYLKGPRQQVGEVTEVQGKSAAGQYRFLVETVSQQTNQHRVTKIYPVDRHFLGFAAWRLFEIGLRTLVTYDVYNENPAADLPPAQLKQMEQQYARMNSARFQRELERLKQLVEGGPEANSS